MPDITAVAGANLFQRLAARLRPVFSRASRRLTLTGSRLQENPMV